MFGNGDERGADTSRGDVTITMERVARLPLPVVIGG